MATLQQDLLRGLMNYASNVDAVDVERALDKESSRDDLRHLDETRRLVSQLYDHICDTGLHPAPPSRDRTTLTRRQTEVLEQVAGGMCTAEIAECLHISLNTVRNHVQSILEKFHVHTRLQAVSLAIRWGLIKGSVR